MWSGRYDPSGPLWGRVEVQRRRGGGLSWAEPPAAWRLTQLLLVVSGYALICFTVSSGPISVPLLHAHTNLHCCTCEDTLQPSIHSVEAYHNHYTPNPNLHPVVLLISTPKPSPNPKINLVEPTFLHMWSCEQIFFFKFLHNMRRYISHTYTNAPSDTLSVRFEFPYDSCRTTM